MNDVDLYEQKFGFKDAADEARYKQAQWDEYFRQLDRKGSDEAVILIEELSEKVDPRAFAEYIADIRAAKYESQFNERRKWFGFYMEDLMADTIEQRVSEMEVDDE